VTDGVINKFNQGEVSPLALARDDVTPVNNSCELMENFLPMRLGPMQFRPGFEYVVDCQSPGILVNSRALRPMSRKVGDSVLLEHMADGPRVIKDGVPFQATHTGPELLNNSFTVGGLASWGTSGAAVTASSNYSGSAYLTGSGAVYQTVSCTAGQSYYYVVTVHEAPLHVQVGDGTGYGADNLIDSVLFPGRSYLAVTPLTNSITFSVTATGAAWGDGHPGAYLGEITAISSADPLRALHPGGLSGSELQYRASDAISADTAYVAVGPDSRPHVVRRIGNGTITREEYFALDGPFKPGYAQTTGIQASARYNSATLTATSDLFDADEHVGRLLKLTFPTQTVSLTATTLGQTSGNLYVQGYGSERDILVTFQGDPAAAVSIGLYRYSVADAGIAVSSELVKTYTSPSTSATSIAETVTDSRDGEAYIYFAQVDAVGGGIHSITLTTTSASCYGVVQITSVTSPTSAAASVRRAIPVPGVNTAYWQMGTWGPGEWPQGVTLAEGRLLWAGKNRVDATATDDYYSFNADEGVTTDAISRTIGFGSVENIQWLEANNSLFLGLPSSEAQIRSSNFEDPLSPLNTMIKPLMGSVGASAVRAVTSDDQIYFASRDGRRLHALDSPLGARPSVADQMTLHPDICVDGIRQIVVTKHPETRIWVLTETGELRVLLKEPTEDVQAWCRLTVDGEVEAIATLPQTGEDELWAIIRRNGNSRLYRLSTFSDSIPLDFYTHFAAPGTATLTGLSHLEGETVHVWADNQFLANTYTVTSGQITIDSAAYANVYVGKQITAKYKSNKLGQYSAQTVIGERFRVTRTALVMKDFAPTSIKTGRDFTHLHDLPGAVAGPLVTDYDEQMVSFGGTLDTDSRICIQATGPCKIMALAYNVNVPKKTAIDG